MASTQSRIRHLILLLIVVFAFGIRLSAINRTMRWDEGRTFQEFAKRPPAEFLLDYSDTNNHFLNSLIMHVQYRILGDEDDWKLRVHVLIIGIFVTVATYYTGRELYDEDVGLMASALSSVMYLLVEFSINARAYIIITLIFLILIILLNRMKTQASRRGWVSIGLLSALGFFVSPVFLYSVGILGLWVFISIILENQGEHRRRVMTYFIGAMILGAILTLLIYIPAFLTTYQDVSSFEQGTVAFYVQSVDNFWDEIIPEALNNIFNLFHIGMSNLIIIVCLVGTMIAMLFHYKFSNNKFPLFLAIPVWLSTQLMVQQTVIFERAITFLAPLYAIWIAVGLIAIVRFITWYKLSTLLISIILSVVLVIPTAYTMVRDELLFKAWITASMPYGREIAEQLPDIEYDQVVLSDGSYAAVLDYYVKRDNIDISLRMLNQNLLETLELGDRLIIIEQNFARLPWMLKQYQLTLADSNFVLEPIRQLNDLYTLFELKRIPPTLKKVTDIEDVDTVWFTNLQKTSYTVDIDNTLIFDIDTDDWEIIRYRFGDHWQDYTLSSQINIKQSTEDFAELAIYLRDANDSYYSLEFNMGDEQIEGQLSFKFELDEVASGIISQASYPLELNQWYNIKVTIEGSTLTAFIDGVKILEATSYAIKQGSIAFLVPPKTKLELKDVQLN